MTFDITVAFGLEELPYNLLLDIGQSFMNTFREELYKQTINYGTLSVLATPRRLVLKANRISKPIHNVYPEKISLYDMVYSSLKAFVSFRPMCWNDSEVAFKFIRPLHTLSILLNNKPIPGSMLGVSSNRTTNGHRHIGSNCFCINHANSYHKLLLEKGKVVAAYSLRLKIAYDKAKAISKPKRIVKLEPILLSESVNMVEWVSVSIGVFNKNFLRIPKELLVFAIKNNQKSIPTYDSDTRQLLPYYIVVSNIIPDRASNTISGLQKIIRPRLIDALYFLNKDRYKRLEYFIPDLNTILFERGLGSLREKNHRIECLSSWTSQHLESNHIYGSRAGLLSKCDLATKLVYEFKDIYGFVGMYYAKHDNEPKEVVLALMEQYLPRSSSDIPPTSLVGSSVCISDKADSLIGILGINGVPKNNRDPYSSKRYVIGILRIIIENRLTINLKELIKKVVSTYGNRLTYKNLPYVVSMYYIKRLKGWYQSLGYNSNTIRATLCSYIDSPLSMHNRLCLLKYMQRLKEHMYVIESNKRIVNITINHMYIINRSEVSRHLLRSSEEVNTYRQLIVVNKRIAYLLYNLNIVEASLQLIILSKQVCDLFKGVYIIDKPIEVRSNRIILLYIIKEMYSYIGDMVYI